MSSVRCYMEMIQKEGYHSWWQHQDKKGANEEEAPGLRVQHRVHHYLTLWEERQLMIPPTLHPHKHMKPPQSVTQARCRRSLMGEGRGWEQMLGVGGALCLTRKACTVMVQGSDTGTGVGVGVGVGGHRLWDHSLPLWDKRKYRQKCLPCNAFH